MANPGKPAARRQREGNPSGRGLNTPPRAKPSSSKPPKGLSRGALGAWRELAPVVIEMGVLTVADRSEFARLCELKAEVALHRKTLNREGWTISQQVKDTHGRVTGERIKNHPASSLLNQAERKLAALMDRFGLNPLSRERLDVKAPAPETPEEDVLKKFTRPRLLA